jgi:glycosyltransferase involved in cell wall biosynthesis
MVPLVPDDRPLRVLCVTNMWPRDDQPSYGTFVHSQTDSMARRGVDITVHMIDGRRNKHAYLVAALRFLARNLDSPHYDLVHAHTGHCGVVAALQRRVPVVVSFVGYDVYGTPAGVDGSPTLKSRLEAMLFHQLPRFVAGTITKSRRMHDMLPASAHKKNMVLPNGVDRGRFFPIPRDDARRRLGWNTNAPIVLFAGNPANPRKRFDVAEGAVALCRREEPATQLQVCWGLPPADVPLLMSAADVLMLPSVAEGSPNVVKEALACDLPVVAADVGDVPELLSGIDNCHVVDREPGAFADAALQVLRSGGRCEGRAKTADLDIDQIAERLQAFYEEHARARLPAAP